MIKTDPKVKHFRAVSQNITHKKAFTLVEILVSVLILSIIAGSLYVVFKVSMDAWRKSGEKLEIYQKARAILEQVSREVESAVLKGEPDTYYLLGENGTGSNPDTLTFICSIPTNEDNQYDICRVRYYLSNSNLMRRIYRDLASSGSTATFAEGIVDLQLKYWDASTPNWAGALDTWDSRTGAQQGKLPRAIKIQITTVEENKKFETVVYLPNS